MLSNNYGRRGEISERVSGGERLGLSFRFRVSLSLRVDKLLTGTFLLSKARLLDSVMPRQLTAADEQSENKAKASRGGVEDPHAVQGMCVGAEDDVTLGGGKAFDKGFGGAAKGRRNGRSGFRAQRGNELG